MFHHLNHKNPTKTDFFLISKEFTIENSTSFYGCFYLGPFETRDGLTIGNSLRRTLLTCVGGFAITAVEIEGVSHEYSSIPGLKETVLDLLLSMNDIVFTTQKSILSSKTWSYSPTGNVPPPSQIGYLKKSGPGIIYAHDLRLPPGICCVNPTHMIGTLSDIGHLNMKFEIQYGKNWKETKSQLGNYNRQESKKPCNSELSKNNFTTEKNTLLNNEIILNPVFNPIKKVNYTIESLNNSSIFTMGLFQQIVNGEITPHMGEPNLSHIKPLKGALSSLNEIEPEHHPSTNLYSNQIKNSISNSKNQLEIIILEIWTDGSIHPRDALSIALRKCVTTFSKLGEIPRS